MNTYIGEVGPDGARSIHFHPPFTLQHPDLTQNEDARRILFDPERPTDSQLVEYFGFGHPIVDHLVNEVINERHAAAAAVRRVRTDVRRGSPGWQFNWRISVGGLKPTSFIYPIFVDDRDRPDLEAGARLHEASRMFGPRNPPTPRTHRRSTRPSGVSERLAAKRMEELLREARDASEAACRRRGAASGALRAEASERRPIASTSCARTLEKMRASSSPGEQRVIPVWEANLRRAEAELRPARQRSAGSAQSDLAQQGHPDGEYVLLNLARIEPVTATAAA